MAFIFQARGLASRLLLPSATLLLAACSLINAPDEVKPGSGAGGSGATGGGGNGGGGAGAGGSGGMTACTGNEECASLTTACATGECSDGSCVATPQPAGTECGAATGQCDLADTCDGAGQCSVNFQPNGSYCSDCEAGLGNCAACNAGVCGDCAGRATLKTFRHPLSTSGWTLTGGWKIYAETPPETEKSFNGPCDNGIDDDGDGMTDLADPGCEDRGDPSEFEPSACGDGNDNDGDTLTDLADPDCSSSADDNERFTGAIAFDHPVLGTDGNRKAPYGYFLQRPPSIPAFIPIGGELEQSSATSPATLIPTQLEFLSWSMDEGSAFDLKAVQLSLDGTSFTTIAICPQGQPGAYPFCQPSNQFSPRPPDAWDVVILPVPEAFQQQIGFVRFVLDTKDSCCNWERGWYLDALNFAQDCACAANADCSFLDSGCATGECDQINKECTLAAQAEGAACAGPEDAGCGDSSCDEHGFCNANEVAFDGDSCSSCDTEPCDACVASQCLECPAVQTVDFLSLNNFSFGGDFSVASCLSVNSVTPAQAPCFPNSTELGQPMVAPVLGSNGSRTGVAGQSEVSAASMRTAPTLIPSALTFRSWHQDRGGNDTFVPRDTKLIRVSVDGGNQWTTVLNCDGNMTTPFCIPSPPNVNRPLDQWDDISLPIPANLQGQTGLFEFSYNTVDAGAGWERGWYIDDLNINRCDCLFECSVAN